MPAAPSQKHRFAKNALISSVFTLCSRFSGLFRDAILARVLALSSISDAFFIGFLIPNLFRRLFGEGALTSAFMPNLAELDNKDPQLAKKFTSIVLTALTLLLLLLVLIGELGLWVALKNIDFKDHHELAVRYTMLMLPYMPLVCLVAFLSAVMQHRNRFAIPAAVPIVLNGGMIVAGILAITLTLTEKQAGYYVAYGVLIAGVIQVAWLLFATRKEILFRKACDDCRKSLKNMLVLMVPMALSLGIYQINTMADSIASFLLSKSSEGPDTFTIFGKVLQYPCYQGSVAALNWAQRLYQFPVGVFGIAIATAIFPALNRAVQENVAGKPIPLGSSFHKTLCDGIRLSLFIGIPASIGIFLIRMPLTRVIYEGNHFSFEDSKRVATILGFYTMSIWAYSLNHVLNRAYHARKDAKTPMKNAMIGLSVNVVCNIVFIFLLGTPGLALSTAISSLLTCTLNLYGLSKLHLEKRWIDKSLRQQIYKISFAGLAMGAMVFFSIYWLEQRHWGTYTLIGFVLGATLYGVCCYLGIGYLLKLEDLNWAKQQANRILSKMKR